MYAGTGYAHCSLSGTNAYHIHAHRNTQFIHAKSHRICKNKYRTGVQTCPVQKYSHTYYTQRHTTYLNTQHEWTHSLDVIMRTPYPLQPLHHIHQHTWAQKMHKRSLFHVFILSRIYSAPGVSQDLQYYLPIITTAPKTGVFIIPNV